MEAFWIIFGLVLHVLKKISMFLRYSFHALLFEFFFPRHFNGILWSSARNLGFFKTFENETFLDFCFKFLLMFRTPSFCPSFIRHQFAKKKFMIFLKFRSFLDLD